MCWMPWGEAMPDGAWSDAALSSEALSSEALPATQYPTTQYPTTLYPATPYPSLCLPLHPAHSTNSHPKMIPPTASAVWVGGGGLNSEPT